MTCVFGLITFLDALSIGLEFEDSLKRGGTTVVFSIIILVLHTVLRGELRKNWTSIPRRYRDMYETVLPEWGFYSLLSVLEFTPSLQPLLPKSVTDLFLAHCIALLAEPACSPDLFPIEHVWSLSGEYISQYAATGCTLNELWLCKKPLSHNTIVYSGDYCLT